MREFQPVVLKGTSPAWRPLDWALILALTAITFAFRAWNLSAEGFADDEIHKWLAAEKYTHGIFGGDDVEHPMIMKALIALAILVMPKGSSPEMLTRLPNAFVGALTVWAIASLGKRLFGRGPGLIGAMIFALSAMSIGYGRIGKEDTLLTLFLVLLMWCFAEAKAAADDRRTGDQAIWEIGAAVSLGLAASSKYQLFWLPLLPALYGYLRLSGSAWRVPMSRWIALGLVTALTVVIFDWALLMPSTWSYLAELMTGKPVGDRGTSESYLFMGKLWANLGFQMLRSAPIYYFFVFPAVKLAPPTVILVGLGLLLAIWRRGVAHGFLMLWLGFFLIVYFVMSVKYARYFQPIFPVFILLAGYAAAEIATRIRALNRAVVMTAIGVIVAIPELYATISHMPHPRLYINALAGGDSGVDYYYPHCDYFDSGVREAVQAIAARAEPNAEIAAETGWPVRYYLDQAGRTDITETTIRPNVACLSGHPCYVISAKGRFYWHNQAALTRLASTTPWQTINVAEHPVIHIYRIEPGQRLFPPQPIASAGQP